jgi:hypothetical protein
MSHNKIHLLVPLNKTRHILLVPTNISILKKAVALKPPVQLHKVHHK